MGNKKDAIVATAIVLSSACLLSPLHAALYVAGSGVMLYTSALPMIRNTLDSYVDRYRKLYFTYDGLVDKNLYFLSKTIPQCALFYITSALFKQPLNEFLNLKGINSSANQLIVSGVIRAIAATGIDYDSKDLLFSTKKSIKKSPPLMHCIQSAILTAFLYFTGFDKNYPMVFATTSIALVLLAKSILPWSKNGLPPMICESLTQLCVDKLDIDLVNPILALGRLHAHITAIELVDMAL